jgi:hypothetical protein
MALVDIKWRPSRRELRQFGLLVVPPVAVFFAVVARFKWHRPEVALAIGGAALVVMLVGALAPLALRPLFVGLSLLTFPIGWVVSLALLAVVFYAVLTPIAVIMRLVGEDPMKRRFDRQAKSYWIERRRRADVERYFRQF